MVACLRGTLWLRSQMSTCEEGHAQLTRNCCDTLCTCYTCNLRTS